MKRRRRSDAERAAHAVARKGITIVTGQGPRSKEGGRFPESARLSAQAAIRRAMAKRRASSPEEAL